MGLYDLIFGKKPRPTKIKQYFELLNGYIPSYTSFSGGVYEMLQTKAIINTIATDCGKAIPELAKKNKKIEYMLKHRPNQFMSTSTFIERVVTSYLCDNNSFIVPILDDFDRTVGLFPITYSQVTAVEYNGIPFVEYSFINGTRGAIEYSRVGHLRRMQYKNDLFGDRNSALDETMEIIHSQSEAIQEALKNSGAIRFQGKLNDQLISKEDFDEERKLFSEINFDRNNSQFMIFDSRYEDVKQVESKAIFLDEKQQQVIDENLRNYFGVGPNAVQHKFANDYEWNSYYEGVIEPILIKLGEELTKMLFTSQQIMTGNVIYVTSNRLQYMSNESKLSFSSQMFDRGVINGDTVCDIWQLPHYEGGDKHYIRKEYAEVGQLGNDDDGVIESEPLTDEGGDNNEN